MTHSFFRRVVQGAYSGVQRYPRHLWSSVRDAASSLEAGPWYESRFGWTAPVQHNAFVSLATSFAFLVVMLGIATWRLSRIDF